MPIENQLSIRANPVSARFIYLEMCRTQNIIIVWITSGSRFEREFRALEELSNLDSLVSAIFGNPIPVLDEFAPRAAAIRVPIGLAIHPAGDAARWVHDDLIICKPTATQHIKSRPQFVSL